MVRQGEEPHAWGGPRIRWASRQDPGGAIFVLDDLAEEKDCASVRKGMESVVRSLTTGLDTLRNVVVPVGQVHSVRISSDTFPLRASDLHLLVAL